MHVMFFLYPLMSKNITTVLKWTLIKFFNMFLWPISNHLTDIIEALTLCCKQLWTFQINLYTIYCSNTEEKQCKKYNKCKLAEEETDIIHPPCHSTESLFIISSHKIKKSHEVSTRSFNVKCVSEILKWPRRQSEPLQNMRVNSYWLLKWMQCSCSDTVWVYCFN